MNNLSKEDNNKPLVRASRFEEFWNLYPKKKSRASCESKWKSRNLDKLADLIIVKLKEQIKLDDEWIRGYAPNPETYLTQSRWEDEISKPKKSYGSKQNNQTFYDDNDTSWAKGLMQ